MRQSNRFLLGNRLQLLSVIVAIAIFVTGHGYAFAQATAEKPLTDFQKRQLAEEIAKRKDANQLANEGKYDEALKAAKRSLELKTQRVPFLEAADNSWLRDLEAEKEYRDEANRLRADNRFDAAIAAAKKSLELKVNRAGIGGSRSTEDDRWLTEQRSQQAVDISGLLQDDLRKILDYEFRDKWFDYKAELHDGGKLADEIAQANEKLAELSEKFGDKHPQVVELQSRLDNIRQERTKLLTALRKDLDLRERRFLDGNYFEASNLTGIVADLKRQIYGENDLTTAISNAELARIEQKRSEWSMAHHYFESAAKGFAQIYGPDHWRTKDAEVAVDEARQIMREGPEPKKEIVALRARTYQARILLEKGDLLRALSLARQGEASYFSDPARPYSVYAVNQASLAAIYRAVGQFHEAEACQRRALEILKKVYGEQHPDYLVALNNLYELYKILGDRAQAQATARLSLTLTEKVWGSNHGEFAVSLNNLGEAELADGRLNEGRGLFIQALKLSEQHFANYNQMWTASLQNLAEVHRLWGEFAESARLLRHVLKNRTAAYGPSSPDTLEAMHQLAVVETDSKNYDAAAALLGQALEASRLIHGPKHIRRAEYLMSLARVHRLARQDEEAASELRECLEIARVNLDTTFTVLSERRQLAMTRDSQRMLDAHLDLAVARKQPGEQAYEHVLSWKGAILGRQQQSRLVVDEPDLAPIFKDYQQTVRDLATLALATLQPQQAEQAAHEISRLSEKKDRLEGELSNRSEKFRASQQKLTIDALKASLPSGAALVDFLEYSTVAPAGGHRDARRERRLVAFVVTAGEPVQQVDLGDASEIGALGDRWRTEIMRGRGGVARGLKMVPSNPTAAASSLPQVELRRRLWEPLEPYLQDVKFVLLSPDGVTTRLPWTALPGRQEGKYLVEDLSVAFVPSPAQLVRFSERPVAEPNGQAESMLLVGDVDFAASAGTAHAPENTEVTIVQRSAPRFGNAAFSPLPGTGKEVRSIAALFRERYAGAKLHELVGAAATEDRLRETGPGHRYLHFATHGFFAPALPTAAPRKNAADANGTHHDTAGNPAIADIHPGLLSGIVLAGANSRVDDSMAGQPGVGADDGILTALELAALDLNGVDLAILSACETGLGQSAGGEGVLGLQRSLQLAGARSTVASLWKVDDTATQVLMIEFYRNLWEKRLSKLEALRQAQLTMLERYDARQQKLLPRGLKSTGKAAPTAAKTDGPTPLAPYLWAAFQLSGDWR